MKKQIEEKKLKYLVINKETYEVLINEGRSGSCGPRLFDTKAGAKRALTAKIKRIEKKVQYESIEYAHVNYGDTRDLSNLKTKAIVIDEKTFQEKEPMVIKKCLRTGETYYERLNTPSFLSRASETFWAM